MTDINNLITDNINVWTSAIKKKSATGRGSNKKIELTGIKKLRQLILELALRGKLVPQDINDEPASVLLEKIAEGNAQLILDKKIKKQKALPEISKDDKSFKLPNGWSETRFGEIYLMEYGNNLPKPKRSDTGEYNVYGSNGVVGSHNESSIQAPCIVIGRKGSAGALNLSKGKGCWVTDVAYSVTPPNGIDLAFAFKQFHTMGLDTLGKGIKPGLNRNEANLVVISIPPLAEQHRIVAKVDELMALCDQLEQQTEQSLTAHQTLVEVLLAALFKQAEGSSDSTEDFQTSWQRIADHFDVLFTTEQSIEQLKQTILQLAVMGKLVPQNPSDEPASVLLDKIAEEKAQLIADKKIKKQKPLPAVTDEEKPFGLPSGWEWVRLGNIGIGSTGKTPSTRNNEFFGGNIEFIGPGNITPQGQLLKADKFLTELGTGQSTSVVEGALLMVCIGGSIGKSALASERISFNQQINAMQTIEFLPKFLKHSVSTDIFYKSVLEKSTGSATPIINRGKWEELLIPAAPLSEQHRIVAKVDELMALCDQLKTRLADAQITQLHLAEAVVEQALN